MEYDCPECGSKNVTTTIEHETIKWGQAGDTFECDTPVRHCECGFQWIDNEGMNAHDSACFKFEKSKGIVRNKFVNEAEKQRWESVGVPYMIFEKLVFVNVGNVSIGPLFSTSCNGIMIDWGNWYNERPFNGMRDITLFTVGGYDIGRARITPYSFDSEKKEHVKVPVYIQEIRGYQKPAGEKIELTEGFQFTRDAIGFELIANDVQIRAGCDDSDQPMKMIHFKGEQSPFGEEVERWISPYIVTPNRPFIVWHPNPNRRR